MKYFVMTVHVIFLLCLSLMAIKISSKQAQVIGKKIWMDECAGTINGTSWNDRQEFASASPFYQVPKK